MDTVALCAALCGAAFVFAVCAAAGKVLSRKDYVCRVCGSAFKAKWYKIVAAPQHDGDRLLYCEKCCCKSWCARKK